MKKYSVFVMTTIFCLALWFIKPVEAYAAYDYANDNTGLVYPNYTRDISNDYYRGEHDFSLSGENLIYSGDYCTFYKTNLTENTLLDSSGYVYSDPVHIKVKLGVPVTVRLTWGMVTAYENATNTIYVHDDVYDSYHTVKLDDFMAVVNDDAAFKALQHKARLETVAMVKDLVAKRNNKTSAPNSNAIDSLKNSSVNSADFNAYVYYANNSDLQTAIGADANALYNHWQQYGKTEGRKAK
ncbi:MAG: hypothetical protein E7306_04315 [Butyrivibrio sp.]|nr:hypothetical protein [Butyrivibrio sp.]